MTSPTLSGSSHQSHLKTRTLFCKYQKKTTVGQANTWAHRELFSLYGPQRGIEKVGSNPCMITSLKPSELSGKRTLGQRPITQIGHHRKRMQVTMPMSTLGTNDAVPPTPYCPQRIRTNDRVLESCNVIPSSFLNFIRRRQQMTVFHI